MIAIAGCTGVAEIIALEAKSHQQRALRAREEADTYRAIIEIANRSAGQPIQVSFDAFADFALRLGFSGAGVLRFSGDARH